MRRLIAGTQELRHYTPRGDGASWATAASRLPTIKES
jgi:rhamnulokinase